MVENALGLQERMVLVDLKRFSAKRAHVRPAGTLLEHIELNMNHFAATQMRARLTKAFARAAQSPRTPQASTARSGVGKELGRNEDAVRMVRSLSAPQVGMRGSQAQSPGPPPPPPPLPDSPPPPVARGRGLLFRCQLCGLATDGELEPTADGDRFVHTRCGGVQFQTNTVAGSGLDVRTCVEEDPLRSAARAEAIPKKRAEGQWYGTAKERALSLMAERAPCRQRGLNAAQSRVDSCAARESTVLPSASASRLRVSIEQIGALSRATALGGPHGSQDPELENSARNFLESAYLQASRTDRLAELSRVSPAAIAAAALRTAAEQRERDQSRRKSPVFSKKKTAIECSVPDSFGIGPMHVQAALMILEEFLGESGGPRKRPPSRGETSTREEEGSFF